MFNQSCLLSHWLQYGSKVIYTIVRAVGRSENLGEAIFFDGHNWPSLVEIGLTDHLEPLDVT